MAARERMLVPFRRRLLAGRFFGAVATACFHPKLRLLGVRPK